MEVKRGWYERYNRWFQSKMEGTSWQLTRNCFTSPTGKLVTQGPFGAVLYGALVRTLGRFSEIGRRRDRTAPREAS